MRGQSCRWRPEPVRKIRRRRAARRGRDETRMKVKTYHLVAIVTLLQWSPLLAQEPQTSFFEAYEGPELWGVSASYNPRWVAPGTFRYLIGAETIDLRGADFHIGFARGRVLGGEWGLSYVSQTVDPDSEIALSDRFPEDILIPSCSPDAFEARNCGVFYGANDSLRLRGLELHRFIPFATFADRVQVGMNIGGGAGWYEGTASRRVVNRGVAVLPDEFVGESVSDVPGSELTLPRRLNTPVPILNLDIAVAGIVARGVKIRGGAGVYGFPGRRTFVVSATYFFGAE